jgi:hypothetical protein
MPLSAAAPAGLGFYPEKTGGMGKIFFENRLMYIRNPLISSIDKPQNYLIGIIRQRLTTQTISRA